MVKLTFDFYNNRERCYPGSAMAGQVILETTKYLCCSQITVEPSGISKVLFHRFIQHEPYRGYSNQERYFSGTIVVYECADPLVLIPPGKHSFPFRFIFPQNCVPTFKDPKGKAATVKYELIATMKIRKAKNVKRRYPLIMYPIIDLNMDLNLCRAVQLLSHKTNVEVVVYLPRSAFLENEQVPVRFKIYNGGIRVVKSIDMGINYNSIFKGYPTTQRPKYSMRDFSSGKSQKVSSTVTVYPGHSCHLQHMLEIKSKNNSSIDNCPFLENEFQFYAKIYLKGISKPLILNYPIQISKVIVSLKENAIKEVNDEPIKRFFVPGKSSLKLNKATFEYGPFKENELMVLMDLGGQNNPKKFKQ